MRDGKRWELEINLAREQLPNPDSPAEKDGLVPADLALLSPKDGSNSPRFSLLWCEPEAASEQRRLLADLSEQELSTTQSSLTKLGFVSQSTIAVWTDKDGQRHYGGIWSNQGAPSELKPAYAGFELVDQPQWDVAVAPASKLGDPLVAYREQLAQIKSLPPAQWELPQVRLVRAESRFRLGQFELALVDLDFLVAMPPVSTRALYLRAWTLARLDKAKPARAALAKYLEQEDDASMQAYVQIVLAAWLGDHDAAFVKLEAFATSAPQDSVVLYNAGCAAALASRASAGLKTVQGVKYLDRAVELLRSAVAQGYADARGMVRDPDLVALHDDPRFLTLLEKLVPAARYAALWRTDVEFESRLLTASSLREIQSNSEELVAQDYRPVAITSMAKPSSASLPSISLIFHRPIVPDESKEHLAHQQTTAAVALLRLKATEPVWPLFEHQSDPRLRSNLLHRLVPYGADSTVVIARLQAETEVSRRRALILSIGEFARSEVLTDEQESSAVNTLADLYSDDPDPGIHAASEWTLRQLDAEAKIGKVRTEHATGKVVGDRQWYVTKTGLQTMMIIDAHTEFLMGSPVTEIERYQGPTGKSEARHRRRIGRKFAIGSHEVTVAQFEQFREDHAFDRTTAREDDAPANRISWYSAAAYCNWLSHVEGMSRDQWCYDPEQRFEGGMKLVSDYLQRTGYRLPTEAEWEFACRAESTTSRFFAETPDLLGKYAWYTKNSSDRWLQPVGRLKPNDVGLFDMHGNVNEWCQDPPVLQTMDREWVGDPQYLGRLNDSESRVLRGASFISLPRIVRSAYRLAQLPVFQNNDFGFRVTRTYP